MRQRLVFQSHYRKKLMAHNTNFTAADAAICGAILSFAVVLTAVYGGIVDIFHGHWAWFLIDLMSGGIVAVIRGVGYFFGWIVY